MSVERIKLDEFLKDQVAIKVDLPYFYLLSTKLKKEANLKRLKHCAGKHTKSYFGSHIIWDTACDNLARCPDCGFIEPLDAELCAYCGLVF